MQVIGALAEVPLADPAAWLSDAAKRRRFDLHSIDASLIELCQNIDRHP
jgi:hypothetical protein